MRFRHLNEQLAVHSFPFETIRRDGTRLSSVVNARLVRDNQGSRHGWCWCGAGLLVGMSQFDDSINANGKIGALAGVWGVEVRQLGMV